MGTETMAPQTTAELIMPVETPAPAGAISGKARRGFTGTQLKMIAIIVMLIDHIAAIPLSTCMGIFQSVGFTLMVTLMRCIGRMGFPIFCFLLVEGFLHTSDVKRYAMRLAAFALVSEVAFDFALNSAWLEFTYQNVFFTLLLGLLAIWSIRSFEGKWWLQLLAVAACIAMAELFKTDYAGMGVVTIVLFYVLRNHRTAMFWAVGVWLWAGLAITSAVQLLQMGVFPLYLTVISAAMSGVMEALGAFSFLFIGRYNGERGAGLPKYFFYAFYPAHLLILGLINQLILHFAL